MPFRRSQTVELAALLNSIDQPLYVLDEDLTVIFLNHACREWLGQSAEGVIGKRCAYHSSTTPGIEAVVAGLCPPPEVLTGRTITAVVHRFTEDGRCIERSGRFIPLSDMEGDVFAVVAILDAADLETGQVHPEHISKTALSEAEGPSPIVLHEQICRFRQELAGRYRAERLIGSGLAMRLARRRMEVAAVGRESVLLLGPPGSGRRHIAAAIHYAGRGDGVALDYPPFLTFDCFLLGGEVLQSMAIALSRTKDELPGGAAGTLLLHRVDELPLEFHYPLTELLLRNASAWRLVATAARSLTELARQGKFHAELASLLSTLIIELPPLKERREDIPLLAQLFLEDCNAAGERQIGGFTPEALDLLDAYSWPGNVEELADVVTEAHRRTAGRLITPQDLPERLRLAVKAAGEPRRREERIVLQKYLEQVERELIRRALTKARGNKAHAAKLLGVTRARLYRRILQLGVEQP